MMRETFLFIQILFLNTLLQDHTVFTIKYTIYTRKLRDFMALVCA